MKRKLTFIITLAISFFLSYSIAEEQKLVVKLKNGTENEQPLSNVQKITFNAGSMTIALKNGQTGPVSLSDIQKILFSQTGTGIEDNIANNDVVNLLSVYPNPVQDVLFVEGVEENTVIRVFNIKGALFQTVIAKEQVIQLNVSALQQGMYILQAGNQAIKFIKK
jgi:hypothetical protein